jgi:hypothetical protein
MTNFLPMENGNLGIQKSRRAGGGYEPFWRQIIYRAYEEMKLQGWLLTVEQQHKLDEFCVHLQADNFPNRKDELPHAQAN